MNSIRKPYLTKTSYVTSHTCERWLWKNFYERPDFDNIKIGSAAYVGEKVGALAQKRFDGGKLVNAKPWEHDKAVSETKELMLDQSVQSIYEAALEYNDVRVRVDILERLEGNNWGIREVKSKSSIRKGKKKILHEDLAQDVAVQMWVAEGFGLNIISAQLLYVDKTYKQSGINPDHNELFVCEEVIGDIDEYVSVVDEQHKRFLEILEKTKAPSSEPANGKCSSRWGMQRCPFWKECISDKPDDWVAGLYRVSGSQLDTFKEHNIDAISDLTPDLTKNLEQDRMVQVSNSSETHISNKLYNDIRSIPLPAIHLDFEFTQGSALPLYQNTKPYELIPFQYSIHTLHEDLSHTHTKKDAYLATGDVDPRREFTEKLIARLSEGNEPIIAYHAVGAESRVIKNLMLVFPDLEEALTKILERIVDIKPMIQNGFMHPRMISKKAIGGLYSLKNVAPAINESFSYNDLVVIQDGGAAAEAFYQLVIGEFPDGKSRAEIRQKMLDYCEKDTEGTVLIHKGLLLP